MENVKMDLLENKELRESLLNEDRLNILDKVKQITTLGGSIYSTVEQVAEYYEVGIEAVKSCSKRNKEELQKNGLKYMKKSEILLMVQCEPIEIPNRGVTIFTKRAILNVGMLLTESKIAEEVRSLLLDNHEQLNNIHEKLVNGKEITKDDINKSDPNYFINKEKSLREQEKELSKNITEAILKGNMQEYLKISCQVNKIKEDIILLQKEKEELNKPKVEGYDTFINTDNLLSWDTVAKNLGMGRNTLLKLLREHKVLQTDKYEYHGKTYSGEHHNVPYQSYMKYFEVKFTTISNNKRKATTKVTADGQAYILKKLKEWEQVA